MKRRAYLAVAAAGIVAQFGAMAAMIARREIALSRGVVCRFRTAPVDPYDAFRGRYVALSFEASREGARSDRRYDRGQRVFAKIGADLDGYTVIQRVARAPDDDGLWLKVRVSYGEDETRATFSEDEKQDAHGTTNAASSAAGNARGVTRVPTGGYRVHVELPFDRYYMEEALAPEAESAYREASVRDKQEAVVVVRVWRGLAVIERLEVGGRPLQDVARERLGK